VSKNSFTQFNYHNTFQLQQISVNVYSILKFELHIRVFYLENFWYILTNIFIKYTSLITSFMMSLWSVGSHLNCMMIECDVLMNWMLRFNKYLSVLFSFSIFLLKSLYDFFLIFFHFFYKSFNLMCSLLFDYKEIEHETLMKWLLGFWDIFIHFFKI
jgi:hypothetical protein